MRGKISNTYLNRRSSTVKKFPAAHAMSHAPLHPGCTQKLNQKQETKYARLLQFIYPSTNRCQQRMAVKESSVHLKNR